MQTKKYQAKSLNIFKLGKKGKPATRMDIEEFKKLIDTANSDPQYTIKVQRKNASPDSYATFNSKKRRKKYYTDLSLPEK